MNVARLVSPLTIEQGLYLLDKLTWFPESGPDRLQRIADYIAERTPDEPAPSPETIAAVLGRLADPDAAAGAGRWAEIPEAKRLYELKYDVKAALLPSPWFSFMNMGWLEVGGPQPDLAAWLSAEETVWTASANLYDRVAGREIPGSDVLEVGCGRGGGAGYLARRYGPRSYTAVDQSGGNLEFARSTRTGGIHWLTGDAEALTFADESIDTVVNIESAHCYPRPERFLAEVHRVLRPGGRLALADEWWLASADQLPALVEAAGLTVLEQEDLTPGIIESLHRLREPLRMLIDEQPAARRTVYERFFGERVLKESLLSYTSGRFSFTRILAEKAVS